MKRLVSVFLIVAVCALLFVPAAFGTSKSGTPLTIANTNTQVGFVSVNHQVTGGGPGNLVVSYYLFSPWKLQRCEVACGTGIDDLPVNRASNPVPGKFQWKSPVLSGLTSYSVIIPVADADLESEQPVYFAAHAKVTNGLVSRDAWGYGNDFPDAHNGGMYFVMLCTNPD